MELYKAETIKEILKKHGLWTKKSLGQNFLIDKKVLEKIVNAAEIKKSENIVEVGPGLGVLTKELAKAAGKVTSIEIDKELIPILEETLDGLENLEIINADALKTDVPKTPYKVVANIPYYISSPLLMHFLQSENRPESITLLIQKELAEKIMETEPDMTVLSLQVNLFGTPKIVAKVPANAFLPAPKVQSSILTIRTFKKSDKNYISNEDGEKILKIAKRAFSQRRKKLQNSIPELKERLRELEFAERRPQSLSIEEWKKLI